MSCWLLAVGFNLSCSFEGKNSVCFNKTCFEVEIATTPEELQQGLQNRQNLDLNKGMLFIFSDNGIHRFWMKNTLIPLDIIWMDASRRVVHIEKNIQPCKRDPCPVYVPKQRSLYVLEINAGISQENGFQLGDMADFDIL